MDPVSIGARLVSSAVAPLVKKLFVSEGPGAGLVDKPVRLSGYVSFRGEKRTLGENDLRKLAAELVRQALRTGERPLPADEERAVTDALTSTLYALGDLTLSDVEAVELGHTALARELRRADDRPERQLSTDATYFYERLLDATCLHILNFFTQRSTFVAATLVAQSRRQAELIAKVDELISRRPLPGAEDVAFEQRYLAYVAKKHSKLTIFGIDLSNSPGKWPLDAAYLSLEATAVGPIRGDTSVQTLRDYVGGIGADSRLMSGSLDTVFEPRPADQALAEHDRVLLRGEAGSGKTTLVQWLAVSAARQDLDDRMAYLYDRIPFVLPLRTLTRHGERLPAPRDFLAAVGSPLAGEQPAGWETRVLNARRGLVLVDGIDEIPDAERSRTRGWLSDLIDAYPGNRWLVTSRPSAIREDWLGDEDFTELALSPMRPADVAAFIKRWHSAARTGSEDEDTALLAYEKQLLEAVRAKPDLGRLATNPLMCGMICALHRDRHGFLPHGRKDLYTAALSMLLVRRDRERNMGLPELREEPQIQLLQRLAYWLIRNGRTEMDRSRAESIIADALPALPEVAELGEAKAVFDHFLHRSGLLREQAPGTVDFIHRTFQDFLGARAAVEEGDFGMLVRHAANDQWEDVIRMAVAHARPRERVEFFGDLLSYGDENPDDAARTRVHLLAAACLEDATELSLAVRQEVERRTEALIPPRSAEAARELAAVGPMILDLLDGPERLDEEAAEHVVIAASHVASERAIPFLARFCGHQAERVRAQLIWSWDRFHTQQYAAEVISRIDPTGLYFTARTDEQLDALRTLGPRPMLDARGPISPSALLAYTDAAELTRARIRENPDLRDVSFLRGQSGLTHLTVAGCPRLTNLTGICRLPLRTAVLDMAPGADLGALSRMDRLEILTLGGGLAWSTSDLPARAPLRTLDLVDMVRPEDGLRGLGRHSALQDVSLGPASSPRSAEEWAVISRLPRISALRVSGESLALAPFSGSLANVERLTLLGRFSQSALDMVPELFPSLTSLVVSGPTDECDVTSLAALTSLQYIELLSLMAVRGVEQLPGRVRVLGRRRGFTG
ncbi:NACHT domain-containing protein [Streptomyces sp. ISL-98]|uniref:NACHT domain-containing protein n=1 Tax=Streptomyces sp. ISL-98 TaxID=2819192 RepID=UPI001BE913F2|nr:NACHT domain-containing protein [Streptomyces sp. ISL-98]MBT2506818.1 NACHT domain-containing protein [Streptomyces sp. ISL-98]